MSINKKILAIQQEVQVEKTGFNEKHGFTYFREEDVVNAVKLEMNKRDIIVKYEALSHNHEAFYDSNGRYRPRASGEIKFTFVDTEDESELSIIVGAEGSGTGDDVSSRKLATQARKIAFLQLFQIGETNERYDSDSQPEQEPVNMTTPAADAGGDMNVLTSTIGDLIRGDNAIDAPMVKAVGTRIAAELGVSLDQKEWKSNVDVLAALVKALKNGEVE